MLSLQGLKGNEALLLPVERSSWARYGVTIFDGLAASVVLG